MVLRDRKKQDKKGKLEREGEKDRGRERNNITKDGVDGGVIKVLGKFFMDQCFF